jgi:hypothetical protein
VSNVGYQYLHFHYNPAHMIAITSSSRHLRLVDAWRPGAVGREPPKGERVKTAEHENTYFRDILGWSVGTLGIHRLGLFWPCPPASGARSASSSPALLDPRLAGMVGLVAQPADLERSMTVPAIPRSAQAQGRSSSRPREGRVGFVRGARLVLPPSVGLPRRGAFHPTVP